MSGEVSSEARNGVGRLTARTRKVFEIVVTFMDNAVMGSANGVLLAKTALPDGAVKLLYSSQPSAVQKALDLIFKVETPRDSRFGQGDILGWLVFGSPTAPTPIGDALARGLELVNTGGVTHVRIVLDFLADAKVGTKKRAETLSWELMRWHGEPQSPVWVGVSEAIALVRQRRGSSYVHPAPRRRRRLNIDYFTAMRDGNGLDPIDIEVGLAMDLIHQRFSTLSHRVITSEEASFPGHRLDTDRFTDVIGLFGDGSVLSDGTIGWTQFPAVIAGPHPSTTVEHTLPPRDVIDRLASISGHPTLLVLIACSGASNAAELTETGETLGDAFVRSGAQAVVTLFAEIDRAAAPAIMYFLICALLEGDGLDVAVQRLRRSLQDREWQGEGREVEWQKPMLTISSTRVLANKFDLDEQVPPLWARRADVQAWTRSEEGRETLERMWQKRIISAERVELGKMTEKKWWPRRALEQEWRAWTKSLGEER